MSDLEQALCNAAGPPPGPADLSALLERLAQRRRRRTVLTPIAIAVSVLALGLAVGLRVGPDAEPRDLLIPASAGPTPSPVLTPLPSPVPPPPPSRAPSPAALPAPPSVPDGIVLGLITASDGRAVTWDQVDLRAAECDALPVPSTYAKFAETCFSNTNPQLRTAPLSPAARIRVWPNGPPRDVTPAELAYEISARADNDTPVPYRLWKITVVDGTIVAVESGPSASA